MPCLVARENKIQPVGKNQPAAKLEKGMILDINSLKSRLSALAGSYTYNICDIIHEDLAIANLSC